LNNFNIHYDNGDTKNPTNFNEIFITDDNKSDMYDYIFNLMLVLITLKDPKFKQIYKKVGLVQRNK